MLWPRSAVPADRLRHDLGGACAGMLVERTQKPPRLSGSIFLPPISLFPTPSVPTQGMPAWLRVVADWNPVSAVSLVLPEPLRPPHPASTIHAWPMQHPELATVVWSIGLIAVSPRWAVQIYRGASRLGLRLSSRRSAHRVPGVQAPFDFRDQGPPIHPGSRTNSVTWNLS